jgi:hypothetical protein
MMKQSLLAVASLAVLQIVAGQDCCDVLEFSADSKAADGTWTVTTSMWAPYESAGGASYCDFIEIRSATPAGGNYTVLGKRVFNQAHPDDQPFERMVGGIALASGEDTMVAIAHDSVNGYCGESLTLTITGDMPTTVTAPPAAPSITPPPVTVSAVPVAAPVISAGTTAPVAAPAVPAQGGMGGGSAPVASSTLPSVMPSDTPSGMPSFVPSSMPSDGPSVGGGGEPTRASSASGFGFGAVAAVVSIAVSMFLL